MSGFPTPLCVRPWPLNFVFPWRREAFGCSSLARSDVYLQIHLDLTGSSAGVNSKPLVYLETSFISHLTARASADLLGAAKQ
jgi:hypothetical protein